MYLFFIVYLPGSPGDTDMRVKDLLGTLDRIAPFKLAEAWDNIGLLVGDPERKITAILIGLDPTGRLLDEAIGQGANTIITHHPLIFHPLPAINTSDPTGLFLEKALTNRMSVIACHTNLDSAHSGVSDVLADSLGLVQIEPLLPGDGLPGTGIGRIGNFPDGLNQVAFMNKIFHALGLPGVQVAGLLPDKIFRLAVCGGSGSDFAETAYKSGADVYLSAEIKHSTARWAQESGFCIIDGTHYATEQPVVKHLVTQLQLAADSENWGIPIRQTQTESHPFTYKNKELFR
jgi:dinuclear metal center YbgI/SA1388 family protein